MNNKYEQELQEEILNEEEIQYDNDDVENEYLKHLWDQSKLFVVVLGEVACCAQCCTNFGDKP